MFKFLKEKLGQSISKITKKIEEESPEEEIEVEKEVKEERPEIKEEVKPEEVKEEPKKEEKPSEEEKKGLFGKFRKFFKKEEKAEEEKPVEEIIPEKKKVEGEKLLKEIKKDFTEKEEVRKKEEEKVKEKEEVEKRIKEKIKEGKAPLLQDLIARREALKPKEEKVKEKPKVEEKKPEFAEKEIKKEPSQEDIVKALAAGKKIEEVKKEEPKAVEKPKEEEIVKAAAGGEKVEEIPTEKKGFFAKLKEKIITKKINEKQFDELFWELEVVLLENNVAVEVIEKIKNDLKTSLLEKPVPRGKVNDTIITSLKDSVQSLFDVERVDIFQRMEKKKPLIICFVGVNGSGKTTAIAKISALLQKYKFSSVMAASDTFRAAAINQLEEHANNLGVKLIKHDYGADPAAVAFDAVKYAESKGVDAVLIDTAGRLHSNVNLMDEMKKIVRVAKPDLKIFVGESITGNDCVEQAKQFNEAIGIDGIILTKADVDEKGGAAISVSYVTKKPIIYLGIGQKYEDLEEFDSGKLMSGLGL
ncbi:signal recognition particle-docking protein FtsY [Candidatus Woesearchaeota archaeon]|nr:signal recognition particle-docking protein FtsY [Candidatus Woesearchaeota archaeon]